MTPHSLNALCQILLSPGIGNNPCENEARHQGSNAWTRSAHVAGKGYVAHRTPPVHRGPFAYKKATSSLGAHDNDRDASAVIENGPDYTPLFRLFLP